MYLFILWTEFHVGRMQTKFLSKLPARHKRLSDHNLRSSANKRTDDTQGRAGLFRSQGLLRWLQKFRYCAIISIFVSVEAVVFTFHKLGRSFNCHTSSPVWHAHTEAIPATRVDRLQCAMSVYIVSQLNSHRKIKRISSSALFESGLNHNFNELRWAGQLRLMTYWKHNQKESISFCSVKYV